MTKKAADAFKRVRQLNRIRRYATFIVEAVDEDTRPGGLLKLGVRGMADLAGKALGRSLTTHPYFQYHKIHLEALGQALNATSNHEQALAALNRAIRSADASATLSAALSEYHGRKKALGFTYAAFIAGSLSLLRDHRTDPEAARQLKDAGHTPESLQLVTDHSIFEWRALWCELFLDGIDLLAMIQVELRATEAAMQRFDQKMKALSSGGNMGKVAAYAVEQERQWQQFERMTSPAAGNAAAVEDPVRFARAQADKIKQVVDQLAEGCESVMSEDAYRAAEMVVRLGRL